MTAATPPANAPAPDPPARLTAGVLAAFVVGVGATLLVHEPWRDEMQAWLLARHSASLGDLLRNLKYEGHPPLWHLSLFALARLTADPRVMQAWHLALAAGAAWVLVRHAPFTAAQRVLLPFGYFLVYEYAVVSRHYVMGVLLLWAACALGASGRRLAAMVALAVACHTSVHALVVAVALAVAFLAEGREVVSTRDRAIGVVAVLVGALTAAVQIAPPPDSGLAPEWHLTLEGARLADLSKIAARVVVPIPVVGPHFWNSYLLGRVPVLREVQLVFGLVAMAALLWTLRRRPALQAAAVVGAGGLLAFTYVKYLGDLRHHGFLFLLAVGLLWLLHAGAGTRPGRAFTALLAVHAIGGMLALGLEWRLPFSAGTAAAAFIRDHGLGDRALVGETDWAASTVAAHLDRPVYYPRAGRYGTFVVWNRDRMPDPTLDAILGVMADLERRQGRRALLIRNRPLRGTPALVEVAAFPESVVADEALWLYERAPAP